MELNKQNFIQIIKENRGTIRSLCKIYFRSTEDQKDAFQDIILQLWKSFDTFRGESSINTWIYRVSINTILTKINKEKNSVSIESLDLYHTYLTNARADDNSELLFIIIQSLKDIDKAIFVLHLEGYGNKEIAHILNISPTNVSTRFNRIKSQLNQKYNKVYHAYKQAWKQEKILNAIEYIDSNDILSIIEESDNVKNFNFKRICYGLFVFILLTFFCQGG